MAVGHVACPPVPTALLLGDLGGVCLPCTCELSRTPQGIAEALVCPPGAHFPFSSSSSPKEGPSAPF